MSWQVGDLAVCVDARPNPELLRNAGLTKGRVYRVAGIDANGERHVLYGRTAGGLFLEGMRSGGLRGSFAVERFRKILPDKHEDCEPEFVTLLNRTKRKSPLETVTETLIAEQEKRWAWLIRDGEQLRKEREGN